MSGRATMKLWLSPERVNKLLLSYCDVTDVQHPSLFEPRDRRRRVCRSDGGSGGATLWRNRRRVGDAREPVHRSRARHELAVVSLPHFEEVHDGGRLLLDRGLNICFNILNSSQNRCLSKLCLANVAFLFYVLVLWLTCDELTKQRMGWRSWEKFNWICEKRKLFSKIVFSRRNRWKFTWK